MTMRSLALGFLGATLLMGNALAAASAPVKGESPGGPDPYMWLSDVYAPKAMAWARAQTAKANAALKNGPMYAKDHATILKALNAEDRIAYGDLHGKQVLNFWQDKAHVRGIWRSTSVASYATGKPQWHTLLDLDAYDKKTGKDWVWKGASCDSAFTRCLVRLSPGGGDAVQIAEFDPQTGAFLNGGFKLAIAKSNAFYVDDNSVLFSTDFGKGTMTTSSYPRIVKLWKRGQKIADAKTIYEGTQKDVWVQPSVMHGPYGTVAMVVRGLSFFEAEYFLVKADGTTVKLPLPTSAQVQGVTEGQMIATLRDAWTPPGQSKIVQGALIAFDVQAFARTGKLGKVSVLMVPGAHDSIDSVSAGRDAVFASVYHNVTGAVHAFGFANDIWTDKVLDLPKDGSTQIVSTNDFGPEAYLTYQSFVTPPTLYGFGGDGAVKKIKAMPARFDAAKVSAVQHWATSKDGTKIPYFVIKPKGAKGPMPTILYGYGGFELSLTPWYWNDGHRPLEAGSVWVEHGGAIVVANIRGGGEFGPAWHQAALKYHRQRAYDDFEAVAEDIEKNGLTTPKQLGIVGASNGGLLVTTVMTERPDLFGAVVCQRPLIDMVRYTQFGAGASWIGEYGDPADPKMRKYIETYSPYQNVKKDVHYPPILFISETTDDRVTPIWARMMAAKMEAQGHEVLLHEANEGGHGPGATHAQQADYWALSYTYFARRLGLGK